MMRSRINSKRTRKAVEEPAQRNAQGQLHNLRLGKMLAQRAEQAFGHAVAVFPGGHGIFRHQPINRREGWMINPPRQAFQSLGRDAFHGQERPVMIHAVITGIELGNHHNRQFQMAPRQRPRRAQFHQHWHQMAQRRRHMGEDRQLLLKRAIAGDIAMPDVAEFRRQFLGRDFTHTGHGVFLS